ncbi:MAG: 23S rRNA (pseudouridine(1915)-N(3))-methyltransferase RlmH [Peptoniphilus sp.]|nr:23S rRNA (pseudouridine(1915)-N(3))-methyltransferase RlmH [Peptoniphilus sp.]MDD7363501.1 23S rRNA (pseudouridine(1915)-N(3))-methyltransferase RlmH [Bacillota bacterium]MDY6044795.1 23S rRNA (pseudouridine(1915)-N(3))-methyltransferase RlmH [Peptoniphilus sp.]
MQLRVIALGKLKSRALQALTDEYVKRLNAYVPVEIIELKDERAPEHLSEKEKAKVLEKEADRILSKVQSDDFCIPLVIEGKSMDSVTFSKTLFSKLEETRGRVVFIIGSSMGMSPRVKARGDLCLSFSPMTLPHTLMRPVLLEQIYRASRIHSGHVYHK